jgi:aspartate dehydrogenase
MMKFALLGCGNIGGFIANAVYRGMVHCELVSVYDKDPGALAEFRKGVIHLNYKVAKDIDDLIEGVDLVVEAASQAAVKENAVKILSAGKDLMVLSVGALADESLFREMKKVAKEKGARIYIPSGGIVGLDGMNAARLATIDSVTIITRKPPASLGLTVDKETVVYDGPATEGVKKFPLNVNVAATLGVATVGLERVRLTLIADPAVDRNIHEVHVKGDFGEFTTIARNLPSRQNPKTSWVAALSAIAMIRKMCDVVHIGT